MVMCPVELAATHESAHACLHLAAFGHPLEEVVISADGDGGHCRIVSGAEWEYEPDALAKHELLLQHAICCCAGRAAMDKVYGYKPKDDRNWRASEDRAQAMQCCLTIADGDEESAGYLLAFALRRAEMLVERHWPEINRVAYGLLVHEQLTGEQVREIIETVAREHEPAAA